MSRRAPSLIALVVRRIVLFAAMAMAAQVAGVFLDYWYDTATLGRLAIELETTALAPGLSGTKGHFFYQIPEKLRVRYGTPGHGYFMRVLDPAGATLFSNCADGCGAYFPTRETRKLDFWMMEIQPGKPLNVSGGRSLSDDPDPVTLDVAIVGDPEGVIYSVLARAIADHMALPMSLLLICVLGGASLSIAQALRPVRASAKQAAKIDPLAPTARLPVEGMPREIANYTKAVNDALERVFMLMQSQRLMTSAISHEIRSPLAAMRLELEQIADPRARKLERDLDDLNRQVEQLTTLARLEGAGVTSPETIDPVELAQNVVARITPEVFESGRSIAFAPTGAAPFRGHRALIENALRNLIDNAVKHSGEGATILVTAGPGPSLAVFDDGGAPPAGDGEGAGRERGGLGLRIVGRIAEMHGGHFEITLTPGQGAKARISLPEAR
ncbi:sensor histidine kinase [Rhodoblastus sp.]|uniref:sensor histidine kinase n=1 Tax=Rhodoblastus sp. TaxID=1962975 RepID=UPI0035AF3CE8